MGSYGLQSVATGACVHFIDEAPDPEDLRVLVSALRARRAQIVYLDCARYLDKKWMIPDEIGYQAGTEHPPYSEGTSVNWTRWWDDLLSLGSMSPGLVIVMDNAGALWTQDRKFLTDLVENFLHAQRPWIGREVPYHLCLQLANSAVVGEAFGTGAPRREA